jgi:aminopeptidase N
LRTRIGDKAFFEFLQHYLNRFKGKRATADDFFGVLREHTTVDISDLMNEYFQTQH